MHRLIATALVVLSVRVTPEAIAQNCGPHKVAVQVLGSGGPFPSSRASSGYIVWVKERSVVLVDAGGGVFLRFGEAGARVDQLALVAISHLHPDHVSDLSALLWLTGFRRTPLQIIGPSGNEQFPAFGVFLDRLLGGRESAFPILSVRDSQNPGRAVPLQATTVDVRKREPSRISTGAMVDVAALGVPHSAPALAFRVSAGGANIVFGGDQNGLDPQFIEFARRADLLIMHFALSSSAAGSITDNHATPAVVGQVAFLAGVQRLLLSHIIHPRVEDPNAHMFSGRDPATLAVSVGEVRRQYAGSVDVAEDLRCVVLRE